MHSAALPMTIVALGLGSVLSAQATDTIPKGFMTTAGNYYYATGFHPVQHPARNVSSYAASTFPAVIANGGSIHKLGLRADAGHPNQVAHTKEWRIYMSTDGFQPHRPRYMFDNPETVHGSDKKLVVGTTTATQTISFPAVVSSGIQPFFDVFLDAPMTVPLGAKNLIIDFRSYSVSTTSGDWFCDARMQLTNSLGTGSYRQFGTACPTTLNGLVSRVTSWPDGDMISSIATGMQQKPVVGLWGTTLSPSLDIGSGCFLHVTPLMTLATQSDNTTSGFATIYWGTIPNNNALIGAKWSVQFAVINTGFPYMGTIGVSNAYEWEVGPGRSPAEIDAISISAWGTNRVTNPDTVAVATNFSHMVPILRLN